MSSTTRSCWRNVSPTPLALPIALCGDDARRPQFPKAVWLWLACQDFIHRDEHLVRHEFRSQVAEILHCLGAICTTCRQYAVPIGPRHRSGGRICSAARAVASAAFSCLGQPAGRLGWSCGTTCRSSGARSARSRSAATSTCSAWRMICPCVRTMLRIVVSETTCSSWVWDAEQACQWGKRQLLGSRQAQEMEAAGDNHAMVGWEHGSAGEHVGLRFRVLAHLPRHHQRGYPLGEAAGDLDGLMTVGVDNGRAKKTAGTVRSLGHHSCPIALGGDAARWHCR